METPETNIKKSEKEPLLETGAIKKEAVYLCPKIVEAFKQCKKKDPQFRGGDQSDFLFFDVPDNPALREKLFLIEGIEFSNKN